MTKPGFVVDEHELPPSLVIDRLIPDDFPEVGRATDDIDPFQIATNHKRRRTIFIREVQPWKKIIFITCLLTCLAK